MLIEIHLGQVKIKVYEINESHKIQLNSNTNHVCIIACGQAAILCLL